MNIKTLNLIHELLKKETQSTHDYYTKKRDQANIAEEEQENNYDELREIANEAWKEYMKCKTALEDFELEEW